MTVAATRNGRLVYNASFGYADWGAQRHMTNSARARIGSSTKVLVGLTIRRLRTQEVAAAGRREQGSSRSAKPSQCPPTCGSSPPRTATWSRWSPMARFPRHTSPAR